MLKRFVKGGAAAAAANNNVDAETLFVQAENFARGTNGVNKDANKAFALYQKAASQGHANALNATGTCFMIGFGTQRNAAKGVENFRLAASKNHSKAMFNLGNAYFKGDGVEKKDQARAKELFEQAASLGESDASFSLAVCFFNGTGTHKDPYRAFELLKKASDEGRIAALSYLGQCYLEGLGVKKDPTRALEIFEKGAETEDAACLYQLAEWYVESDSARAVEYARRARKMGHADATLFIGISYQKGRGVLMDMPKAVDLYREASELGSARAMNRLGFCYMNGRGVEKNLKKGVDYYERAANAGDPVGYYNLANAYANGEGVKRDQAEAYRLYSTASKSGDVDALFSVGVCLAYGAGVPVDRPRAWEVLTKAAAKGCPRSWFKLGSWYENGFEDTVEKDIPKALEAYRKSFVGGSKSAEAEYRRLIESTLPKVVVEGSKKLIPQFVDDIVSGGSVKWARAKIMVLGKEGVGKTHLYHQIRGLSYEMNLSTDGIDVHTFHLNGMDLTWFDFGGQAVFYPTHQFFLTAQCVYLLCFKFGDSESVERVAYWLRNVQNLARDPTRPAKIVVVGTHADLFPDEADQNVVWDSLRSLMDAASNHVIGNIAVSSQTGEGIDGVLRGIDLAMDAAGLRSVQVPRYFNLVECFIRNSRQDSPKMGWNELLIEFPAIQEHQLLRAFEFFTDMGICVFDSRSRFVIMDPQWLARMFCTLISFSCTWVKNGVVAGNNLEHVWKGLSAVETEQMMGLLERFEVAFPKRSEGLWIVPSLLPEERPAMKAWFQSPKPYSPFEEPFLFERHFNLDLLPFGLFGRLISRIQEWRGVNLVHMWRTGLVIETRNKEIAEVSLGTGPDGIGQMLVIKVRTSSERPTVAFSAHRKSPRSLNARAEGTSESPLPTNRRPQAGSRPDSGFGASSEVTPDSPPPTKSPTNRRPQAGSRPDSGFGASSEVTPDSPPPKGRMKPLPTPRPRGSDGSKPLPRAPERNAPLQESGTLLSNSQSMTFSDSEVFSISQDFTPSSVDTERAPRYASLAQAKSAQSGSLLKRLVEECGSLFDAAFSKSHVTLPVTHFVACPHCIVGAATEPSLILFDECVNALILKEGRIPCSKDPSVVVPVEHLGDDISFGYLRVYGEREVELESTFFASGGFGNIYRGKIGGLTVACKELAPDKVSEGFTDFQREVSLMSQLHHPNVVKLFGVMLRPLRMVLELCQCGDLLQAIRRGQMVGDLQFKVALDISLGMAFMHSQVPPLAHRDLRSPNVFITSLDPKTDVCAKVADFGLSLAVTERLRDPLPTWQWMAPEAQMGDHYTEACDLYSFGVVFYEIISGTGEVPFTEFSSTMRLPEMFQKIRDGSLRPTLPDECPSWANQLISRLWATEPALRPSFRECVSAIQENARIAVSANRLPAAASTQWARSAPAEFRETRIAVVASYPRKEIKAICTTEEGRSALLSSGVIMDESDQAKEENISALGLVSSRLWMGTKQGKVLKRDAVPIVGSLGGSPISCILQMTRDVVLVGNDAGHLCAFSIETGKVLAKTTLGKGRVLAGCALGDNEGQAWAALAPSGLFHVSFSESDGLVASLLSQSAHGGPICGLLSVGLNRVWSCGGNDAKIWDTLTGRVLATIPFPKEHAPMCMSLTSGRRGPLVWIGQVGRLVSVWDAGRGTIVWTCTVEWDVLCLCSAGVNSIFMGDDGGNIHFLEY